MRHNELENKAAEALFIFLEKDRDFRKAVASMRLKVYFEKSLKELPPLPTIALLKLVLATTKFDWKRVNLVLLRLLNEDTLEEKQKKEERKQEELRKKEEKAKSSS